MHELIALVECIIFRYATKNSKDEIFSFIGVIRISPEIRFCPYIHPS